MNRQIDILLNEICLEKPDDFYRSIRGYIDQRIKKCIITANPEVVMMAVNDAQMKKLFLNKDTIIIPDGIGVVNALRRKFHRKDIYRNTGIELTLFLLRYANKKHLKVGIYGAQQIVLDDFIGIYAHKYSGIRFITCLNGYDYSDNYAGEQLVMANADIILIALGTPKQELFIDKIFDKLEKGICVGIGGSLDVLSKHKKRAPVIFIKYNLEWLYRILSEPRRLDRFIRNNILFMIKTYI